MAERQPADANEYALPDEERRRVFDQIITPLEIGEPVSAQEPQLLYIGGQPGAGKSALQVRIAASLQLEDGTNSVLEVNNDKYRKYHPRYRELQARDDQRASFYTSTDCEFWIDRALDTTISVKPHVLLESSLRRPDQMIATAERFRASGFQTRLDLVALHPFQSRLSIAQRYLGVVRLGAPGRYVLRSIHDESVQQIPSTLEHVLGAEVFDRLTLYNRDGDQLYEHRAGMDSRTFVDGYLSARSELTEEPADLLRTIDILIEMARKGRREECLRDLESLKTDLSGA